MTGLSSSDFTITSRLQQIGQLGTDHRVVAMVILIFQARKVERAGLSDAVDRQVLNYMYRLLMTPSGATGCYRCPLGRELKAPEVVSAVLPPVVSIKCINDCSIVTLCDRGRHQPEVV
jgi:hypothetical protein